MILEYRNLAPIDALGHKGDGCCIVWDVLDFQPRRARFGKADETLDLAQSRLTMRSIEQRHFPISPVDIWAALGAPDVKRD
jgi:hypothetical protein